LERHGLATALIGLIGRHVALMRPPRALVVPFELGRPFGAPDEPDFQRRVLLDALRMLERADGPIMETFPDAPPDTPAELPSWSPPIERVRANRPFADDDEVAAAVAMEIAGLRPSYDRWVRQGGRRLDRITGKDPKEIVGLILAYTRDQSIDSAMPSYPRHLAVKFAADDLKHFYYQAALARPARVTDVEMDEWFFEGTLAGRLIVNLREALLKSGDETLRSFATTSFVRAQ
jgi:hypothetical protein